MTPKTALDHNIIDNIESLLLQTIKIVFLRSFVPKGRTIFVFQIDSIHSIDAPNEIDPAQIPRLEQLLEVAIGSKAS